MSTVILNFSILVIEVTQTEKWAIYFTQCLDSSTVWLSVISFHNHIGVVSSKTLSLNLTTGTGGVWFSLKDTVYQNNSLVNLEDIGEGDDAMFCLTDQPACCRPPHGGNAIGNWFFPNGSRVPSSGSQWDFHRTRGRMVVLLHRRRGGEAGVHSCVVPDELNITQSIYIGIYITDTGEWYMYVHQTVYERKYR